MNSIVEKKENKSSVSETKSAYESKIENFNSEFYFDDIIKELSDAGFYSNDDQADDKNKSEKLVIDKNFFNNEEEKQDDLKLNEKSSGIASSQKESKNDSNSIVDSDFKNEIFGRINRINNKIDNEVRKFHQSVEDIKDILETNKNSSNEMFKEVFSRFLLSNSENEENFNNLFATFSNKIETDKTKDVAFEKIYEQMEFYKKDFMQAAAKPFIKDLIMFYDRANTNVEHFNDITEDTRFDEMEKKEIFIEILNNFKDEIIEIMKRNGVNRTVSSKVGDIFDPEKSTVLEKVKTDISGIKDLTIKEVLQEGFSLNGKILRPESVIVYKK